MSHVGRVCAKPKCLRHHSAALVHTKGQEAHQTIDLNTSQLDHMSVFSE